MEVRFKFNAGEEVLFTDRLNNECIDKISERQIHHGQPSYYLKSHNELFYEYELRPLPDPYSDEEWKEIDYFAAHAIGVLTGNDNGTIATKAYKIAFAMIEEKKRLKKRFKKI